MRVGEICKISSGFTARGRLEPAIGWGTLAIQLRDVQGDASISADRLTRFDLPDLPERFLVHGGEVIFRPRGELLTATVVDESLKEGAAVVLPLLILRPDTAVLLPEYLVWAINRPEAQRYFDSEAQGTSTRMIPKAVLERLAIPLPDLATQRRIVATSELAKRERILSQELAERREQLSHLLLEERARSMSLEEAQP